MLYRIPTFRLLFAVAAISSTVCADGAAFARTFAADLRAMLYEAAMLNLETGREDKAARRALQQEQKRLYRWFVDRGRVVTLASCKTEADRANFRVFRETMATFDLLRLPASKRLAFVRQVTRRYAALPEAFDPSLARLVGDDAEALALIHAGCDRPLRLKTRFFGMGATTIGAVYDPPTQTVYLNLNYLLENPDGFVDALDHELWHHLLVNPRPSEWSRNLWWEGYTEALAEQWRWHLGRLDADMRLGGRQNVDYPVMAAMAARHVLENPGEAIRVAGGHGALPAFMTVDPAFLQQAKPRLINRLTVWGWHEDDGSPLRLEDVFADGAAGVAELARRDRRLFRDVMRAIAAEKWTAQPLRSPQKLAPSLEDAWEAMERFAAKPDIEYGGRDDD